MSPHDRDLVRFINRLLIVAAIAVVAILTRTCMS